MVDKVVLTGMRTTGDLHLGHYVGALEMWKKIQDTGEYTCYFLLADVQALTTHSDKPELLTRSIRSVVLDWLSIGLNPELPNVHFVQQGLVLERYALSILFGMVARYNEIMRNPTLKDELTKQTNPSMGFFYYPVDQIADIHMVDPMTPGAQLVVPVGDDQGPILEESREVVRDFNRTYGQTFTEAKELFSKTGRLVGTDGDKKMSKSAGNTINLSDDDATVFRAIDKMPIDPARAVPQGHKVGGNPEKCVALIYHRAINPNLTDVAEMEKLYRTGQIGDGDIKRELKIVISDFLGPIRERRQHYENIEIAEIVREGTLAASAAANPVLEAVCEKMRIRLPR